MPTLLHVVPPAAYVIYARAGIKRDRKTETGKTKTGAKMTDISDIRYLFGIETQ